MAITRSKSSDEGGMKPQKKMSASPSTRTNTTIKPSSSFSWIGSIVVAFLALGISGGYYLAPNTVETFVHTSKSRLLQLWEQYQPISSTDSDINTIDCEKAKQYLTDVHEVMGFHVLCIKQTPMDTLEINGYPNGFMLQKPLQEESAFDLNSFLIKCEEMFDILPPEDETARKFQNKYAFFTPNGTKLTPLLSELKNSIVFLFEGGNFIWPGIKIGHKTIIQNVDGKGDLTMETLSLIPLVFSVEEFLKDEEIDIILELSLPHLKPSGVTLMDGHENRPATDWRTSTTYFLPSSSHEIVRQINKRTADLVKVPVSHQEDVQVLRYEKNQKYDQHTDYFPADSHQNNPDILKMIDYGYRNRMITVFWYMSDVDAGGHTIFPRAGGKPQPSTMSDCSKGLKVPPKKRKVIVFYSMLPNGEGDPMSLHGGCPVEEGIKYSGNKWVWNKPYHP
jgi:prolyl 4-hydroxylase